MSETSIEPVRGNSDIVIKFKKGADAAVDYHGDVKEVKIQSTDKDDGDVTFLEASEGDTKDYQLALKAVQGTAVGSFWRLLWENPGQEFAVTYGPHGNAVATEDKPHFLMTVKTAGRPEIGTAATRNARAPRADFDVVIDVIDGPELDTGA